MRSVKNWLDSYVYINIINSKILIFQLLQATFFTISAINDVIGTNENYPRNQSIPFIRKLKDGILTCLAFPLSMFVGLTFWGLYAVDRELILPKAIDPFLPSWLNHAMHTNIMIFILIEMFISFRKYPSRKFSLTVLTGFLLAYLIWIHYIHAKSGLWVYPILNVLNLPLRIVFFAGLLGLCVILYIVGEKLNNFVWRKELLLLQKSGHAASGKKRKSWINYIMYLILSINICYDDEIRLCDYWQ